MEGGKVTRRSFPNRLAATGRPDIPAPLLLVVCREKRILNIGRGRSMSHGADDEESVLRWFGGYQVEPYRYSGNIAEWRLNGNSLQAWEMVDVPAPGDTRLLEAAPPIPCPNHRSEEHTSELQSRFDLVCRLLLEKKKQLAAHI